MVLAHNFEKLNRTNDVKISVDITFESMLLQSQTLEGLKDCGFFKPSPIQLHGIPFGKCGFDLFLEAKSGTGKTAVFTVVALEKLDVNKGLQSVILAPTREIASQVSDVIKQIGSNYEGLNVQVVMGGLPIEEDIAKFSKNVHILVGSPGRMRHLFHSHHVDISAVRLLVLDEADKLMDKNFQADINYIFSILPQQKQVIMSSATYPRELKTIMQNYVEKAQHICPDSTSVLLGIQQLVTTVKCNVNIVRQTQNKFEELLKILTKREFKQCLIFCNYQVRVGELCKMLIREKWPAEQLHGQLEQTDRLEALKTLQEYKCRILVSTDLAARGIDASNVDVVINFEPPSEWQTYLHRIGRAGRFGSYGFAITILSEGKEESKFKEIIKQIHSSVKLNYLWDNNIFELNEPNLNCTSLEKPTQETEDKNIQIKEMSRKQEQEKLDKGSDIISHKTDKVEKKIKSLNEGQIIKAEEKPVVLKDKNDNSLEITKCEEPMQKTENREMVSFNDLMASLEVYINNHTNENVKTLQAKTHSCEDLLDASNENEEPRNIENSQGLEKLFDSFGPDRDFKVESFEELVESFKKFELKDIENNYIEDLSYRKYFDFNERPELILMLESEEDEELQEEKIIESYEDTGESNSQQIKDDYLELTAKSKQLKQNKTVKKLENSGKLLNDKKSIKIEDNDLFSSAGLVQHKQRNEKYIATDNNYCKALQDAGLPTSFSSKKYYNSSQMNECKQLKYKNITDKCRKTNNYTRYERGNNETFVKVCSKNSNKVSPAYYDDSYNTQSYVFNRPSKHVWSQNKVRQNSHSNSNVHSSYKVHNNAEIDCVVYRRYNTWYKQLKTHIKNVEMSLYLEELSEAY